MLVCLVQVIRYADDCQRQEAEYSGFCYERPSRKVAPEVADKLLVQGIPPGHEVGKIEGICQLAHDAGPDQVSAPLFFFEFYNAHSKGDEREEKKPKEIGRASCRERV